MDEIAKQKVNAVIKCTFCSRTQTQVKKLIAGPKGVYSYDNCVKIVHSIINTGKLREDEERRQKADFLIPQQIKSALDESIIGQEKAERRFRWRSTITTRESS